MASHKYVKRTGTPGNYKYWYKLPDGRIVSQEDAATAHGHSSEEMGNHGKKDHARRLIISKLKGHHAMSHEQMASEVGITTKRLREHISNLRQAGRRAKPDAEEHALHGHDYEEHHLHEGHKDIAHPEYEGHVRAHADAAEGSAPSRRGGSRPRRSAPAASPAPTPAREAAPRPAPSRASAPAPTPPPTAIAEGDKAALHSKIKDAINGLTSGVERVEGAEIHSDGSLEVLFHHDKGDGEIFEPRDGEEDDDFPEFVGRTKVINAVKAKLGEGFSVSAHDHEKGMFSVVIKKTRAAAPAPAPVAAADMASPPRPRRPRTPQVPTSERTPLGVAPAAPAGPSKEALAAARARLARARSEAATEASPAPETRQRAEEASRRVAARQAQEAMQSSSPASEEARELGRSEPAFAESERPITEMLEAQRRGENPYLKRASDIFHNISSDLKPERKAVCDHVFAAIDALKAAGQPINEANLVNKYKDLSGKRIRGISGIAEDFEKGTFMTLDEVMGNAPINVEVERMKRGYAARQFARCKPFLKESFTSANPSAPPPYPTFGDMKTWTEHGGTKPSWAGSTRSAVPREVYDAAVKSPDGKPQYPPAWMPLHLMPVWNYVAKKTLAEGGSPYATQAVTTDQQGMVKKRDVGSQAAHQEGMMKSALRKYVVMRGGAENLVDIPHSKLAEAGMSHSDIFKSDGELDFDHILQHKIVDPVGLMKAVKQEMKGQVQKSWSLVIDTERPGVNFQKSYVVHSDIHKAKIEKVRGLIREKTRS